MWALKTSPLEIKNNHCEDSKDINTEQKSHLVKQISGVI
jgi:hypothetical protein